MGKKKIAVEESNEEAPGDTVLASCSFLIEGEDGKNMNELVLVQKEGDLGEFVTELRNPRVAFRSSSSRESDAYDGYFRELLTLFIKSGRIGRETVMVFAKMGLIELPSEGEVATPDGGSDTKKRE